MKFKNIALLIIRLLIGLMFITTAVLKLLSIDQFEIYIYSFNLFNFVTATILARLLICAEFILGGFLIFKILYKPTWWLTMAMMVGFTLFLIYVSIFRNDSNCHCFGDFVELDPTGSIIKNVVTIILLLLIRRSHDGFFKGKTLVILSIPILAIILTFGLFVPDSLYNQFRSKHHNFNAIYFDKIQKDTILNTTLTDINFLSQNEKDTIVFTRSKSTLIIDDGRYIMGFMASGCKFCRLSIRKLNAIFERNQINRDYCILFLWGSDGSISSFLKETNALQYQYRLLNPISAINLTYGKFPTFILLENHKVIKVLDYREISESEINDFLKP